MALVLRYPKLAISFLRDGILARICGIYPCIGVIGCKVRRQTSFSEGCNS